MVSYRSWIHSSWNPSNLFLEVIKLWEQFWPRAWIIFSFFMYWFSNGVFTCYIFQWHLKRKGTHLSLYHALDIADAGFILCTVDVQRLFMEVCDFVILLPFVQQQNFWREEYFLLRRLLHMWKMLDRVWRQSNIAPGCDTKANRKRVCLTGIKNINKNVWEYSH